MSRHLALFDLDHTLLPLDSDQSWAHFLVTLGIDGAAEHVASIDRLYRDYAAGELDMDGYLRVALAPLARHSRAQLDAWHTQYMTAVIEPAIVPAARELIARHADAGDLCCIVTATNAFVTAPIGRALGFEHLLAIELGTEGDDPAARYTGHPIGVATFREGKITRTEQWLASLGHRLDDFPRSFFYSDSINDLPLLERVTDPVATNPDARLRALAGERGWPVIELFA
ncbi:HAD family hydrolase [Burkholderia plantarii]|uniref:HAD family hydrolase n=1 Tax=Burkholderia plantarii TaxID=41899 RepID=UPI0006D8BD39|nr:HAD family hydrolase [Burkholderia plantarii]ALK29962.1 HAD-superfamily subfamily IB hydrolase [Burkholderia plantarii]GLZ21767.1 haloacid dehalogenase [Burkholderia plantarii]